MGKVRLDRLLVEKGLAEDLKKAQALILGGQVKAQELKGGKFRLLSFVKPGTMLIENSKVEIEPRAKYVSRGGDKLESALKFWNLSVQGRVCLDAGTSTGGFTDCLLMNGAKKIYAVDVGYGQFHPRLRNDPRVELHEKTHILKWKPGWDKPPDLVTLDLSFISLQSVLNRIAEIVDEGCRVLALVKPQFEVGPRFLNKGIVKDEKERERAVEKICRAATETGLEVQGHFSCPVAGAKGNREEWLFLVRKGVSPRHDFVAGPDTV